MMTWLRGENASVLARCQFRVLRNYLRVDFNNTAPGSIRALGVRIYNEALVLGT